MTDKEYECYANLGNQVIITAVQDYKDYHAKLKWAINNNSIDHEKELRREIKKIEEFVDSPLYEIYTKLPREAVWKRLNQIKEKYKNCYTNTEV